jgi:AraC family transcriptional regulator, transcriptional activator FtrA
MTQRSSPVRSPPDVGVYSPGAARRVWREQRGGHRVALVVTNGSNPFEMSVATELFGLPRPELDVEWYRFLVCAPTPTVTMRGGLFGLQAPGTLKDLALADTVIVPNRPDPIALTPPALLRAVRASAERGARMVSFCTGAFVLARAGALDGRRATCHWRWTDVFRNEFPTVELQPDVLYVNDGPVWTSAGSAAALDLSLALVQRDYGIAVAQDVSKRLVFALHRDGGQRQFIEPRRIVKQRTTDMPSRGRRTQTGLDHAAGTKQASAPVDSAASASELGSASRDIARTMAWAKRHLADPVQIADLAARTNVAPSTFHRWFRDATGMAPLQWLQSERVSEALRQLELTNRSVDSIAARSGLGTAANLRILVRRRTGLSPTDYRRNFRGQTSHR